MQIKDSLIQLRTTITGQKSNNHFSIMLMNKILNAISLTDIISSKIEIFYENHKSKRGLINGIGKIQNWLFGTLDSDDKEYIQMQLKNLYENENNFNNNLKQQQSLFKQMSDVYTKNFEKLNENQHILKGQLDNLSKEIREFINLESAFSFSNIIDNLLIQLYSIKNILGNLEIATSFAKLNILHSSILEPSKLKLLLEKLAITYNKEQVPKLQKTFNYYFLFSTQVTILDKLIIFKIHVPLVPS